MNTAPALMQPPVRLVKPSLDALAVARYEQVYAVCHAFHEDPAICLSLANQAFQAAAAAPELVTVSRNLAQLLSHRPGVELPVPSHTLLSNLAWLLKELMGLRYAEIGEALGMDTGRVRSEIAAVRETLLALVPGQAVA